MQDFETPGETTDFVSGKIASIVATSQVGKMPFLLLLLLWLPIQAEELETGGGEVGESKELRAAKNKFSRIFNVSLGDEDKLVGRLGFCLTYMSYYFY